MSRGARDKVRARGLQAIQFGREQIDLDKLEQLVDPGQTNAITAVLAAGRYVDGESTIRQLAERVQKEIDLNRLDILSPFRDAPVGDLARPRKHEIAGAISRFRGLRVKPRGFLGR